MLAGVTGTTASAMPAFLTGAVAVQLGSDIGLDDRTLGLCIGGFFTSAALGSALLGRVAERLGGTAAMRIGLVLTMTTGALLAVVVRSPVVLGLLLVVAGASNALTQPAANLLLVERLPPHRMGIAFAVKQAGMPMASLIGGVLVPAVAVTVGWRWTYVVAAIVAVTALLVLPRGTIDRAGTGVRLRRRNEGPGAGAGSDRGPRPERKRPDLPTTLLVGYAMVGALGAGAASMLTSFLVTAAEASGVAAGPAGLLLTVGSAVGIGSRLVHGRLADGPKLLPIRRVIVLLSLGAVGFGVFALDEPAAYLGGLVLVFGAGWAWPGLFNLSVVRNNPSAPASATGISQTGVYIGAALGPVAGGVVAAAWGYSALWLVAAGALAIAAALSIRLRVRIRGHRSGRATATG
ncbi:MAG: MFS transporter [Actinomycetota bacterium]|nr:MFS transporter [Actinomycetota bacterium]